MIRVPFFVCSLFLLVYSRAAITSTVILAICAIVAFHHPEHNSPGQEVVAFLLTFLLSFGTAIAIGLTRPQKGRVYDFIWMFSLEYRLLAERTRKNIATQSYVVFFLSLVLAVVAYGVTELFKYHKDNFYRLNSLACLMLLELIIAFYESLPASNLYQLVESDWKLVHPLITACILVAVQVDVLFHDWSMWLSMLLFDVALVLSLAFKLIYYRMHRGDKVDNKQQ